jgi:hypothetical protein
MNALSARFAEESSLELHSFLSNSLTQSLEPRLRELDAKDGLGNDRDGRMPPHSSATKGSWVIKGPPHKWRYCILKPHKDGKGAAAVTPRAAHVSSDEILRSLQDELFTSPAFRAWMAIVSRLLPLSYSTEARRFRPGLDYTLATSEDKDARLDVVLGLTPGVKDAEAEETSERDKVLQDVKGWQVAEWGGWEASFTVFFIISCPCSYIFLSVTWRPTTKKMIQLCIVQVVEKQPLQMVLHMMKDMNQVAALQVICHLAVELTVLGRERRQVARHQWTMMRKWTMKTRIAHY